MAFSDTYARAAGQRAAGEVTWASLNARRLSARWTAPAHDGRGPAAVGPDAVIVGVIGSPVAHSLSPVLHNAAFAALGLGDALAFVRLRGTTRCRARLRSTTCAGTRRRVVGHHAAQGRPWRRWWTNHRRGAPARCGQLHQQHRGTLRGVNTDGEGFVAALARGAGFDPVRPAVCRDRRRWRGARRGAGAGPPWRLRRGRAQPDTGAGRHRGGAGRCGRGGRWPRTIGRQSTGRSWPQTWWSTPRRSAWRGQAAAWTRGRGVAGRTRRARPGPGRGGPRLCAPADGLAGGGGGAGATTLDGLGMLVHQAAAQLALWTGHQPPVEAMWEAAEAASPPA